MDIMWLFPREPRFQGLIFDYPSTIFGVVLLYLWFVFKAGPAWMSDREPYRLQTTTRVYNLFQVAANVWFLYQMTTIGYRNRHTGQFSFGCNPPSAYYELESKHDQDMLIKASVFYLGVRIFDFFDTVMFVLAKKQSHISFLHVYHHVTVVLFIYIYLRSGWSPLLFYAGVVNSTVHIVMYAYYFLSTFASMKPYLWWKKYLTVMQIVQFCIGIGQASWNALFNCGYPMLVLQLNLAQVILFLVLFYKFYKKSYVKDKKI